MTPVRPAGPGGTPGRFTAVCWFVYYYLTCISDELSCRGPPDVAPDGIRAPRRFHEPVCTTGQGIWHGQVSSVEGCEVSRDISLRGWSFRNTSNEVKAQESWAATVRLRPGCSRNL